MTAPEDKIIAAQKYLARQGFYVELTAAVTMAGFWHYCAEGKCNHNLRYLIPLTGAGLKST
ncbi:MAG: hypothetical protein NUK65_08840 [Firmicutes bacterium]|nr:hypothetical protein [Bacillota bacterium]